MFWFYSQADIYDYTLTYNEDAELCCNFEECGVNCEDCVTSVSNGEITPPVCTNDMYGWANLQAMGTGTDELLQRQKACRVPLTPVQKYCENWAPGYNAWITDNGNEFANVSTNTCHRFRL